MDKRTTRTNQVMSDAGSWQEYVLGAAILAPFVILLARSFWDR
jgi:hypothetical protein